MPRSGGTVFVVAFVLGAVAFVATLVYAPVPERPGQLSPEELAQREAAARAADAHQNARDDRIIHADWGGLARTARASLELNPADPWAHADLLVAMDRLGEPEALPAQAERAMGELEPLLTHSRPRWSARWALGWARWYAGDREGARAVWNEAADGLARRASPASAGDQYNLAAQLTLAGRHEEAMAAWERAIELRYRQLDFARADYDLDALRADPRFERAIAERSPWPDLRGGPAAGDHPEPAPGP